MPIGEGIADREYMKYWARREASDQLLERRNARIQRRMAMIAEEISDGSSVLDIGCGSGDLLEILRKLKPSCTLRGVDLSPDAVQRARARGFSAEVFDVATGSAEALGEADYVVMSELIEHLASPEAVVTKVLGITRRALVITTPNVAFLLHRLRLGLFGRFPITTVFHIREHLSLWSVADFRGWARSLGLELTRVRGIGGVELLGLNRRLPNLFAVQALYVLEGSRNRG